MGHDMRTCTGLAQNVGSVGGWVAGVNGECAGGAHWFELLELHCLHCSSHTTAELGNTCCRWVRIVSLLTGAAPAPWRPCDAGAGASDWVISLTAKFGGRGSGVSKCAEGIRIDLRLFEWDWINCLQCFVANHLGGLFSTDENGTVVPLHTGAASQGGDSVFKSNEAKKMCWAQLAPKLVVPHCLQLVRVWGVPREEGWGFWGPKGCLTKMARPDFSNG